RGDRLRDARSRGHGHGHSLSAPVHRASALLRARIHVRRVARLAASLRMRTLKRTNVTGIVERHTSPVAPVVPCGGVFTPLGLDESRLAGGFWGERQELNHDAIIPHALHWLERAGWTGNFDNAASGRPYEHRGMQFADSEIYKIIEALSWDRARSGPSADLNADLDATLDANLDAALDRLVDRLAAAQDADGYLHTLFGRAWQRPRYSDLSWGHELYC